VGTFTAALTDWLSHPQEDPIPSHRQIPRDIVSYHISARHHNSRQSIPGQSTNHDSQTGYSRRTLGTSQHLQPSILGPLNSHQTETLAEEQSHPYLYLKPRETSTTVVVSSSTPQSSPLPSCASSKRKDPDSPIYTKTAARNGIQTDVHRTTAVSC
jgi:hypothetical protein